jgi:hypothetical protein
MKRCLWSALTLLAVSCVVCSAVVAQGTKEANIAKLNELREQKAKLIIEYDNELGKVKREKEQRIGEIGREYRLKKDAIMKDIADKNQGVENDYEGRIKKLLKEENDLVKQLGSAYGSNFAKTWPERSK